MDLDNLNNELADLGSDYTQFKQQQINFQEPTSAIPTEKISRTLKSDEHRNQYNERITTHSMQNFYSGTAPNFRDQFSQLPKPGKGPAEYINMPDNMPSNMPANMPSNMHKNVPNNMPRKNQYSSQESEPANPNMLRYSEYGYDKNNDTAMKSDYRQNMNSKLDNMTFDNVTHYYPPMIKPSQDFGMNIYGMDSRVQLQEKGKTSYKDQTNERLSQYSPLSRAAYAPMGNFDTQNNGHGNGHGNGNGNSLQPPTNSQLMMQRENIKETISSRLNAYSPLSRTIALDSKNTGTFNGGSGGSDGGGGSGGGSGGSSFDNSPSNDMDYIRKITEMNARMQKANFTDVNRGLRNVVNDQLPMFSNQ